MEWEIHYISSSVGVIKLEVPLADLDVFAYEYDISLNSSISLSMRNQCTQHAN